ISWPKGQALPIFATPAKEMDAIAVQDLSKDELITFSALQGLVNRTRPEIFLLERRSEEGEMTWPETAGFGKFNEIGLMNKFDLVKKHEKAVTGVVLYDPAVSPHYRNVACSVASQKKALPVTAEVFGQMKEKGIRLKVVEDLTTLKATSVVEIYTQFYNQWWKTAEKRLLVSANPGDRGGDFHHTRDIAAATGASMVWLDARIPEQRDMFRKFLGDMKAGDAVVLGWHPTERSGITCVSEFGIGTLPADFYVSGSVYSGTDHHIRIPAVPKMPALENKVYVSIIISDGDNIQYTQHAMRRVWDRTANIRGKFPLSWTIAPGLVDIGPVIMNYYYTHSTPNDCFVTGPSGMGYMMPVNTLEEPGAPIGEYLKDAARMDGYAKLTETYLQRSGIRVSTIWDDASPMHRASYEKNCRSLYGMTVQNFKDMPSVKGGVENNRLPFDKLVIPYAGSYDHIHGSLSRNISRWDGKEPIFISYQADIWNELKPDRLLQVHDDLMKQFPGKVEFVRADHYFNLHNEAKGLPYNLCMAASTTARSDAEGATEALTDGTPETVWTSSKSGNTWVGFDFGKSHRITRYVIRHAGSNGMDPALNTKDGRVQASEDGKTWKNIGLIKGNTLDVTDVDCAPVTARFFRYAITSPGNDGKARIADMEVYGSRN
ncbi:MAG: protein containing Coagulation factor 5/8 type, partial [Verrucomicrobiaceae bacterium]